MQHRLAIGFKFVERRPVMHGFLELHAHSAYGMDLLRANATLPCLLPPAELGRPLTSPYDAARSRRARAASPRCFADIDQVVNAWRGPHEGARLCDELQIRACARSESTLARRKRVAQKNKKTGMQKQNTMNQVRMQQSAICKNPRLARFCKSKNVI